MQFHQVLFHWNLYVKLLYVNLQSVEKFYDFVFFLQRNFIALSLAYVSECGMHDSDYIHWELFLSTRSMPFWLIFLVALW